MKKKLGTVELAAFALCVPMALVKKIKVRYRGATGGLIRENVFVNYNDIIKLLALETITHRKVKGVRAHVKAFVPSRVGVRTFSDKGKMLTVSA